jgi:hypothetical protein
MSIIMASSAVPGPQICIALFRQANLIQHDTNPAPLVTRRYKAMAA